MNVLGCTRSSRRLELFSNATESIQTSSVRMVCLCSPCQCRRCWRTRRACVGGIIGPKFSGHLVTGVASAACLRNRSAVEKHVRHVALLGRRLIAEARGQLAIARFTDKETGRSWSRSIELCFSPAFGECRLKPSSQWRITTIGRRMERCFQLNGCLLSCWPSGQDKNLGT